MKTEYVDKNQRYDDSRTPLKTHCKKSLFSALYHVDGCYCSSDFMTFILRRFLLRIGRGSGFIPLRVSLALDVWKKITIINGSFVQYQLRYG